MRVSRDNMAKVLRVALLGFAFSLPLSIALSEFFAYGSLAVWLALLVFDGRKGLEPGAPSSRRLLLRNPYLLPVLLFAGVAWYVSLHGARPEVSLDKLHRLLLLAIVFMIPPAFQRAPGKDGEGLGLVYAYLAGCVCLGALDLVRVPWEVIHGGNLYDAGNMRDPQMYLVALCFLFSAWLLRPATPAWLLLTAATVLSAAGMILHFKRGSWFSCFAALGLACLFGGKWKWLLYLALTACALVLAPQARDRLDMLKDEWSPRQGGRYVLWTRVAPALIAQYPDGMGYAATEKEDFLPFKTVQAHLNHLHNNVLQIRLELGPWGLGVWLGWMLLTLGLMTARWRAAVRPGGGEAWARLGVLAAFCGLMINGLVEYNFGDSEILMLMGLLMGLSCLRTPAPA